MNRMFLAAMVIAGAAFGSRAFALTSNAVQMVGVAVVQPFVRGAEPTCSAVHEMGNTLSVTSQQWLAVDDRKSCKEYYPEPANAVNWKSCVPGYRSACGGPPQCYCDSSERLIDYKCSEGTYSICQAENNNGCR